MTATASETEGEVTLREARQDDVPAIRDIFEAVYGSDYPYQQFLDAHWLMRSVFADDIIMIAAELDGRVVGTASFVFDLGAHSDLLGEFGRLVVHPDARGKGVGTKLMAARIRYIQNRVHVGLAQNRCVHPFSQRVSRAHGLVPLGFLPLKYAFRHRESVVLWGLHLGPALALRRNHPRIIPEAAALASKCLKNTGLEPDMVIDEASPPYPGGGSWPLEELSDRGLPALLRIERGRVRHREVFGPMRLQYGFFQLRARHATYLVAWNHDQTSVVGAIGYIRDELAQGLHVFELIASEDAVVRFLWTSLLERCEGWGIQYVEVDVSAYAPRMQRTLLGLGFLPAAYVPAMVFHHVERLDVVKMARVFCPIDLGPLTLTPESQQICDVVMAQFIRQHVRPRIAAALASLELFAALDDDAATRVAGVCTVMEVDAGQEVFRQGAASEGLYLPLDTSLRIEVDGTPVGSVGPGESLGEVSLVRGGPHAATAVAESAGSLGVLTRDDLAELERQRPDLAMVVYRNLARGLGAKLRRASHGLDRTDGPGDGDQGASLTSD